MRTILVLLALCGLLRQSAPALAAYTLDQGIVYDVVTEADGDGVVRTETLKLDLYRPTVVNGRLPLLLYIDGGCYVTGSRTTVPWFIRNLTADGIAVASIDYRLAFDPRKPTIRQPNWPYPAGLEDVRQALRFLRKNKDLFLIDPDRIAAHGESTGGYFAAALGVMPATDRTGSSDEYADRVDIVSNWYGRTDFTLPKSPNGLPCHEYWLSEPLTPQNRSTFEQAGILPHVDTQSAGRFLIMHGNNDPQVDIIHSITLAERLRSVGVKPVFYLNEGWGHKFTGNVAAEAATRRFLIDALVAPAPKPILSSLQINTGRTDTKDPTALPGRWQTDRYIDARAPGSTILYDGCRDKPIANADPTLSRLYWDVRYGKKFGYKIPVANGAYRVRLHFAECRYGKIGQRRFDVKLFAIPFLRNYDILKATAGKFAAADVQELLVIVKNGRLDLSFSNITNTNANINALEIERIL